MAAGVCLVGLLALILLPALARINVDRGRPNTQNHMKVIGLVFKMYANESPGNRWPDLADNERIWVPDLSEIYPEFLQDSSVLVAREHPDAEHIRKTLRAVLEGPNPDYDTAAGLMALSFAYLGHAVRDEAGFQTLIQVRKQGLLDGSGKNIPLRGEDGWVYPFRNGVERFFITDINGPGIPPGITASIPVLVETCAWKSESPSGGFRGANVLFLDGHVELVPLGTFPVVASVMDALSSLAP